MTHVRLISDYPENLSLQNIIRLLESFVGHLFARY